MGKFIKLTGTNRSPVYLWPAPGMAIAHKSWGGGDNARIVTIGSTEVAVLEDFEQILKLIEEAK